MRAAGTYHVRSSGRPTAREVLDFTGNIGGTVALLGLTGLGRGMGDFISEGLANDCLQIGQRICDFFGGAGTYASALAYKANSIPPSPAPNPPIGPSTLQQETVPGAFTPEQAIAGGVAATQQTMTDFYSGVANAYATVSNTPDTGQPSNGISLLAMGAVVLAGIAALSFLGTRRSR